MDTSTEDLNTLLAIATGIAISDHNKAIDTEHRKSEPSRMRGMRASVFAEGVTFREELDAQFGRGSKVGRTGNPFVDDPFFSPWAPGGSFNR